MMAFILVCAYLLGSIPFGLLLSKLFLDIDIRTIGSGNIGATNVLRSGNKKIAFLTLFCDGLKGVLAVVIAMSFQKQYGDSIPQNILQMLPLLAAIFAILGHVFPVWLKFKGGKGVATALGVIVPFDPILFFAVCLLWLITAKCFRISSLSALIAFGLSPFVSYFLGADISFLMFLIGLFFLLLWTHRDNVCRILNGQEGKIIP